MLLLLLLELLLVDAVVALCLAAGAEEDEGTGFGGIRVVEGPSVSNELPSSYCAKWRGRIDAVDAAEFGTPRARASKEVFWLARGRGGSGSRTDNSESITG